MPPCFGTPEDKKKDISDSLLVETILNYGTMDDVKALFNLMGMDKVAEVFFAAKGIPYRSLNSH